MGRQWGLDEIVVVAFAFLGVGFGIFLPIRFGFVRVPAMLVSILLATGIAALAYRFLGGVEGTTFTVGTLKLTGALAALAGIAWLINHGLLSQIPALPSAPPASQVWELHGKVTDENGAPILQLQPSDFKLTPSNTRVDPAGNFIVDFYTEPALNGDSVNYPSLTVGLASGYDSNTMSLEPDELQHANTTGLKLDDKLHVIHIDHIVLHKSQAAPAYNDHATFPHADPSKLAPYPTTASSSNPTTPGASQ